MIVNLCVHVSVKRPWFGGRDVNETLESETELRPRLFDFQPETDPHFAETETFKFWVRDRDVERPRQCTV